MLETAAFYYFSPTGGTKKAGEAVCRGAARQVTAVDLGKPGAPAPVGARDLAVVAVPVFGGRIPALTAERLGQLNGAGKPVITLVVYGTRAYEDALLELNQVVTAQGFQVVASCAAVAQHSMAPAVGRGRPDADDLLTLKTFGQTAASKLPSDCLPPVTVPGNQPYKAPMQVPATPLSLPECTLCGHCKESCPTSAISLSDEAVVTDSAACVLCMACTAVCPNHSRVLPPPLQATMEKMLAPFQSIRRENEFFF
mgnify:CR=1 FL=1